jgi:hypothetical protein
MTVRAGPFGCSSRSYRYSVDRGTSAARRESLDILTRMGLTLSRATVLFNFARVLESHRDHEEALTLFEQSLELRLRERVPLGTARCLIGLAAAAVSCRDPRLAWQGSGPHLRKGPVCKLEL